MILLKDGTSHAYGTVRDVQEQFGSTTYRVTHTGVVPDCLHYTLRERGFWVAILAVPVVIAIIF